MLVARFSTCCTKRVLSTFFENAEKAKKNAKRTVSGGEKAIVSRSQLWLSEVITSGPNFQAHVVAYPIYLTMYGFVSIVVATAAWLVFNYPGTDRNCTKSIWQQLYGTSVPSCLCLGGYWFWFFIRVDVSSEGVKWYNFNGRGDIFIVGLIAMATFALLWSGTHWPAAVFWNFIFLVLFIASSTVLFCSVFWSKFAHMFFKPAAAYQKKRCIKADGSYENLPELGDLSDPDLQAKFPDIPEYMGKNPPNMGPGIKT